MSRYRIVIATLLLCGMATAKQDCATLCNWKTLEGQRSCLGLSEDRVGAMLEQCRKSGLTAEEADALLGPVYAAQKEALPAEAVFVKIEEGLVKKVAMERVLVAAELRLDYLRSANELLTVPKKTPRRFNGASHDGRKRLVLRAAMALESGLPKEVLQNVLTHADGFKPGRMSHVLEAGETLQLRGLDPAHTQQIMIDCLTRNLNRMEIFRLIDYILSEQKKGRDFKSIYPDLWVQSE